jgi:hypothetical protein
VGAPMRFPFTTAVPGALPRLLGARAASSVRASRTATRAGPADGSWAAALPRGAGRLVHDPFGAILKTAFAAGDGAPHFDRRHRHEGVGDRHHRQERYEERRHAPSFSVSASPLAEYRIDVGQGPWAQEGAAPRRIPRERAGSGPRGPRAFELERATPHEGTKVPDEGLGTEPR